ncbi:LuxR C-terminal-related transcriptional regulator [Dehalogenimonas etheniformans]|uniref:LuxR C-terminal-related transcriptional regulator n=1 Tax=Dehalogenimonas etheniformans TaxID=1536648 RepID=UPI000CAF0E95|nr:LuxR C-terminal-related transcriptional regulator [Dehalogenimonas etheniformans]
MSGNELLENIVGSLSFVEKTCDVMRLVDPLKKESGLNLKSGENAAENLNATCFDFWERGHVCENCISMRALNQKRTTVRVEEKDGSIYTVTSVPVLGNGSQTRVVELIKDITKDGIINFEGVEITNLRHLVDGVNRRTVKDALTRVYNEQYLMERLPPDIIDSKKKGVNIALFLVELNLVVDEKNGYDPVQVRLLRQVSSVLNKMKQKKGDWISKFGKMDFVLIFHNVTENGAKRLAKRIYEATDLLKIEPAFNDLKFRTVVGFHILSTEELTPDQFIDKAREYLLASDSRNPKNSSKSYEKEFDRYLLSPREREVAIAVTKGISNAEIGNSLFIGLSTVKKHTSAIFEKTRTKSRAAFVSLMAHPVSN